MQTPQQLRTELISPRDQKRPKVPPGRGLPCFLLPPAMPQGSSPRVGSCLRSLLSDKGTVCTNRLGCQASLKVCTLQSLLGRATRHSRLESLRSGSPRRRQSFSPAAARYPHSSILNVQDPPSVFAEPSLPISAVIIYTSV